MSGEQPPSDARLAFAVPEMLCRRTEAVIQAIREDSTPRAHAEELIEVVIELTHTGMHSYFVEPVERAGMGPVLQSTVKVGVAAAGKGLPTLVRRVVRSMTDDQLREVAEVLDEMLIEVVAE